MGDDKKRLDIIKWIRRFLYAIIFLFLVFSIFLLSYSYIIESYTADSLKAMLIRQMGVVIFVSCSIGLITSELYSKVQSQKVKEELKAIIDSTWEQRLNILKAGITALYPHRGNSADKDVLEHLDSTNEGTIKLIGVSLKVFFSEELAFYSKMKDIIERKPNVKVQVLILNPNCEQALYRSESETELPFKDDADYKDRSILFDDIMQTKTVIQNFNRKYSHKQNNKRIDYLFYDAAPYCTLIMFEDACYVYQNILGEYEINGERTLPFVKFAKDSTAYKKFETYFEFVWKNGIPYRLVEESIRIDPVIKKYRHLPEITGIDPPSVPSGQNNDLKIKINGKYFNPASVAKWNNQELKTKIINNTTLEAVIQKSDLIHPGRITITVYSPRSGEGSSNELYFIIV